MQRWWGLGAVRTCKYFVRPASALQNSHKWQHHGCNPWEVRNQSMSRTPARIDSVYARLPLQLAAPTRGDVSDINKLVADCFLEVSLEAVLSLPSPSRLHAGGRPTNTCTDCHHLSSTYNAEPKNNHACIGQWSSRVGGLSWIRFVPQWCTRLGGVGRTSRETCSARTHLGAVVYAAYFFETCVH